LQSLQANGQTVARLVPEWSPAADAVDRIWMTGDEQAAQLAWTNAEGVHVLPVMAGQGLPDHVPATLAETGEVVAEPAVLRWAEQLFHRSAVVMTAQERWQLSAQSDWNLAQFDLTPHIATFDRAGAGLHALLHGPQWRAARWAAAILVLTQLVGLNAYAWRVRQVLAEQRTAIVNTFTTTFPQVRVVVDAPLQMEREVANLRRLSGNTSQRDVEALLSAYGTYAPAAMVNTAPATIEYVAGELRLSGPIWDAGEVASFNNTLQAPGFIARLDGQALIITSRATP
jgi:general secretion pathway protein L